jgi:hypothetical protein
MTVEHRASARCAPGARHPTLVPTAQPSATAHLAHMAETPARRALLEDGKALEGSTRLLLQFQTVLCSKGVTAVCRYVQHWDARLCFRLAQQQPLSCELHTTSSRYLVVRCALAATHSLLCLAMLCT